MKKFQAGKPSVVMSRDEVRAFDSWAINELKIPGVVLMENAGRSCAELIKEKLKGVPRPAVCIFCGKGNNGGDGYVIARHLLNDRIAVQVVICGDPAAVRGDAGINLDILKGLNQPIERLNLASDNLTGRAAQLAGDCDIVVDAIFGTGLQGQLRADYRSLIEAVNAQRKPVVAVDIPSGLDCDTGKPLPTAIRAQQTVTFAAVKKGFVENPQSADYTGDVYIASIGVEPHLRSI